PLALAAQKISVRLNVVEIRHPRHPVAVPLHLRTYGGLLKTRYGPGIRLVGIRLLVWVLLVVHPERSIYFCRRLWRFALLILRVGSSARQSQQSRQAPQLQRFPDQLHNLSLWHHYGIAGLKRNVFLLTVEHGFVVERVLHLFSVLVAHHVALLGIGKLRETGG